MVSRLGPWKPLMLAFLMTTFSFWISVGSGQSLIDGSLRMRYCSANFSCKKHTWRLPQSGGVAALVAVTSACMMVDGSSGSWDNQRAKL